jgi:hypothetical protein
MLPNRDEEGMKVSKLITPLILLDIDGVMNTTSSALRHRTSEIFAPEPIMALRWLIVRTGARLVITSTRRRSGLIAMRELFLRNNLPQVSQRIISLTPILIDHDTDDWREEEITTWLESESISPEHVVIIDDKPFTGTLIQRLVLTDSDFGLTFELARCALEKFTS